MKRTILVFGLISGVLVGIFLVALSAWASQSHGSTDLLLGYASMVLALSLVYVGVQNFRDKYNDGLISFGKALQVGLGITLLASTIYVLVWLVEFYCFMPDFMDKYAAAMIRQAKGSGLTADALQKRLADIEALRVGYRNPIRVILYSYLEILPVGIVISLLTALLVKRKRLAIITN
ncbi:MAG TPA: DUF4199 domain-containing protein [Puia sp.]|jgi:hypothetical protein